MLYPYKYPKAKIQRLQSFVNYIMLEIVLRARKIPNAAFSVELVIPKYVPIIRNINDKYILDPICRMYLDSKKLDKAHLKILRKAVLENNRIEELCEGGFSPVRYDYLETVFTQDFEKDMLKNIKTFCAYLYDKSLNLAPIYTTYGKIKCYHDLLVQDDTRCHVCGDEPLVTMNESVRNAFDHYLAKQKYPFVSVNFKNLVPTCYKCNSLYKNTKDVLFYGKRRVSAFYPYSKSDYTIGVKVKFKEGKGYSGQLSPDDFDLEFVCEGHEKEVLNWRRIYCIDTQYKSKCCSQAFKTILSDIVYDVRIRNMSIDDRIRLFENNIKYDMNFLKVSFFKAALSSMGINGTEVQP